MLKGNNQDGVRTRKFINDEIQEYSNRLVEAELALALFKKQNTGFLPGESGNYFTRLEHISEEKREASQALSEVQSMRRSLESQLATAKQNNSVINESAETKEITELETTLTSLLLQYTPQHPQIRTIENRISLLKEQLSNSGSKLSSQLKNRVIEEIEIELARVRAQEESFITRVSSYDRRISDLRKALDLAPEIEAQLVRLGRDYEIINQQYAALVERRESIDLSQKAGLSAGIGLFTIVEPPVLPTVPESPNKVLLNFLVLGFSIAVACAPFVIAELLNPKVRSLQSLSVKFGFPILGSVSAIRVEGTNVLLSSKLLIRCLALFLLLCAFSISLILVIKPHLLMGQII